MNDVVGTSQAFAEQSYYLAIAIAAAAGLAILLTLVPKGWTVWVGAAVAVLLVCARVFLVWQGYIFVPSHVRLIDCFLAVLIVAVVGFGFVRRKSELSGEQRLGLAAGVLALPVAAFTALQLVVPTTPPDTQVAACDGASIAGSRFLAVTGPNGLNARTGPSTTNAPTRRFGPDCLVGADGYCVGEAVKDMFVPALSDVRWLRLRHTNDYVAAGLVFGVRAEGELGDGPAHDCPGDLTDPALDGKVSHHALDSDTLRFKARPLRTSLVGFGLDYIGPDGESIDVMSLGVSPQLGITPKVRRPSGLVRVDLSLSKNREAVPSAEFVDLAVVPCLAPIVPSHVKGQRLRIDLETGTVTTMDWAWGVDDRPVQAGCRLDPTKGNEEFAEAAIK